MNEVTLALKYARLSSWCGCLRITNILNAYQDDFDTGKNRDSNFIYGPAMPRTVYVGVKVRGMR